MTVEPPALFDVDALRSVQRPTVAPPPLTSAVVVLGGHERASLLDGRSLADANLSVRRRRGGGGAVHLEPGACWVELWLPHEPGPPDVRATAHMIGDWWREALSAAGVDAVVHRGSMVAADQGAIACFAGLGPGELTVAGRKLVGLSQWRCRQGVLVSSVVSLRAPMLLVAHLADGGRAVPRLEASASLSDLPREVTGASLAADFIAAVSRDVPDLAVDASAYLPA